MIQYRVGFRVGRTLYQERKMGYLRCLIFQFIFLLTVCSIRGGAAFDFRTLSFALAQYRQIMSGPEGLVFDMPTSLLSAEYDFIVVGAGSAGSVVANRLTEMPEFKTLLLEAGKDEIMLSDMPVFAAHFQLTDYNWGYRTQPQKGACLGLNDQRCVWPRGKGMGGSSIINYMIYTRGHPRDYDGWEEMGNPGWGWKDVYKYFLKSENARGDLTGSPHHSTGGYLDVEIIRYRTPLVDAFIKSSEEMGHKQIDYNSGELMGFSYLQVNQREGRRCSASKAFIRPIRHRPNLHVAKEAQVTRVIIDAVTKRAMGIEFVRNNRWHFVRARKEVILSAGVIDTPKLLMLSGIGPREHLESLNIPVVAELPGVGQNLQDHVTTTSILFRINETVGLKEERLTQVGPFAKWLDEGRGPITISGGVEGIGYIRTPISRTATDYPDIELMFISSGLNADKGRVVRKSMGVSDAVYNAVFKPIDDVDAWSVWPMQLRPSSRGWVKLKSKNPFAWPIMSGNYFDDPHDLDIIVEGIKFVIEMSKSAAFQKYNSTVHDIPVPGCAHLIFGTDDYWRCAVRHLTQNVYHQCGTAKMGPASDPEAVVDPQLRVHGINGLRVVDASIIPRIPAAHTNSVCTMIAEKAGDMIKSDYKK
ncbi:glucose dehydrogenase [FAD, quinone]-like [Cloeon dipterum]|uniref:glucose dehydrogenase [FAD, quinone]-like n=1 Tax=Cloeon dipterum TaxID=197152 RepID=UPI003220611D